MVGVFDFPLLRAEKRDKRWLIPLAIAGVVGVWGLLYLDLVLGLVLELVPSCCGVGCVEFPLVEFSLLIVIGLMGGSNLRIKARFSPIACLRLDSALGIYTSKIFVFFQHKNRCNTCR